MPSRSRSLAAVVTMALLATLLSQALAPPASSHNHRSTTSGATDEQRRATVVHRVSPVDRSGHLRPHYRVTSTRRGSCWTSSFVNSELFRCLQRNFIRDPCWREEGRTLRTVICLQRPWARDVMRLRLTKRLPDTATGRAPVWGLTLPRGINCLFIQGASGSVQGHRVSYFCRKRWVLLGEPNRGRVWHIRTARRAGQGDWEPRGKRPLTDAWKAQMLS